jgi:hypothetical protein
MPLIGFIVLVVLVSLAAQAFFEKLAPSLSPTVGIPVLWIGGLFFFVSFWGLIALFIGYILPWITTASPLFVGAVIVALILLYIYWIFIRK